MFRQDYGIIQLTTLEVERLDKNNGEDSRG